MLTIHEHPVQRYSKVFGLRAEGQGLILEIDLQINFSVLVEIEDC